MILLTDEEILKALAFRKAGMLIGQAMGDTEEDKPLYQARYLIKAQLKKVDDELAPLDSNLISSSDLRTSIRKLRQALLEEVK